MSSHQVLIDNRPRDAKEKDYDMREHVVSGSVTPKYSTRAKAIKEAAKYPTVLQYYTSSCGAHSGTFAMAGELKLLEKNIILAAMFMYRLRKNYPYEGMYVHDIGDIGSQLGACLFDTLPTPRTEKEANTIAITKAMRDEAAMYALKSKYFTINSNNIDDYAIASNNLGKFVPLFVWGSEAEWSMEKPEVLDPNLKLEKAYIRHLVTIVPNSAYTYKGKRYVVIRDSSPFGNHTTRHLSEDWIAKRVVCGIYWVETKKDVAIPQLDLTKLSVDLWVGCEGPNVKELQDNLKLLGYYELDVPSTGYFGGYTRKALEKFQDANANVVLRSIGLSKPTGYFGIKTREQMNKIIDNINNKK